MLLEPDETVAVVARRKAFMLLPLVLEDTFVADPLSLRYRVSGCGWP